ncbi:rhomboid family intramembrane serine protease [Blastococcus sp. Marseille-P5729]|uniref:rhomboid family intramembrane serine protease n=1 Tax=Blastococcus sp. Marseille-P5729 TaxID=2086582 RepID=UPI000D10C316|nr:rhomboid family intramembrane serine protease [Blastococcus sp. Marseille-P5729]
MSAPSFTRSPGVPETKQSLDERLSRPLPALITVGVLLLVMVVLEIVDAAIPANLDLYGIEAQEPDGLPGIFSAPFLHHGFAHLWSNAVPFFVLGFLTIIGGMKRFVLASIGIIIISGLFAWGLTFGPGTQIIVGASGWVFGLLTYLLARGVFTRNGKQIVISVVVLALYGSVLLGIFPTEAGVSWQGHLGGAVAGVLMAWLLSRGDRARRASSSVTKTSPGPTL